MKCVRNVVYRPTHLSAARRSGLGDMGTVSIERRTSSSKVLWANIKALSQARHDRLNLIVLIWFIFCLFEICILGSYWINFSFEKKNDWSPDWSPWASMTPLCSITCTDKDHVKPSVLGPSAASLVMGSRYYGPDNAGWSVLMQNITWNIRSL